MTKYNKDCELIPVDEEIIEKLAEFDQKNTDEQIIAEITELYHTLPEVSYDRAMEIVK